MRRYCKSLSSALRAFEGEGWRMDIGSTHQASLDGLAFEGASKRNRPDLKVCGVLTMFSQIPRLIDSRLLPSSMPEFLSPIKTWNKSWNVSIRRRTKQRVLEN